MYFSYMNNASNDDRSFLFSLANSLHICSHILSHGYDGEEGKDDPQRAGNHKHKDSIKAETLDRLRGEVVTVPDVYHGLPEHEGTGREHDQGGDQFFDDAAAQRQGHRKEDQSYLDQVQPRLDDHEGVSEVPVESVKLDVERVGGEVGEEIAPAHGGRPQEDVRCVEDDDERGEDQPDGEPLWNEHVDTMILIILLPHHAHQRYILFHLIVSHLNLSLCRFCYC